MTEIIREYAEALYAIAREEKAEIEYGRALKMLSDAFENNQEYMDFLICPGIPLSERTQAIESAFTGKVPEYVVVFLQLLCEKGRIKFFSRCVEEYSKLVDASKNIATARVTSAVALTQPEKDGIRNKLEKMMKKQIILECVVDTSILGGVVIEAEGRIIDGSLRKSLQEVKEVIGK